MNSLDDRYDRKKVFCVLLALLLMTALAIKRPTDVATKQAPAPALRFSPEIVKSSATPTSAETIESRAPISLRSFKPRYTKLTTDRVRQIVTRAREYGLDPLLVLEVIRQESAFQRYATSYKKGQPLARGLMQMISGTAGRFGVEDPYDPDQAIEGGCKYLLFLLQRYKGKLDLVLAAYNAGEGAVDKYGGIVPPYYETRNYVRAILAAYKRARVIADAATLRAQVPKDR